MAFPIGRRNRTPRNLPRSTESQRRRHILVVGIDPGLSGAIAFYDASKKTLLSVYDMPLLPASSNPNLPKNFKNNKPKRQAIDPYSLAILLDGHAKHVKLAVVEDVHAMTYTNAAGQVRGQGAAASFSFGKSTGIIHGILATCMIPIALVKPAVWKALMNLSSNKDDSRALASKHFPEFYSQWSRKKDDGRAESALLAYFGAMRLLK